MISSHEPSLDKKEKGDRPSLDEINKAILLLEGKENNTHVFKDSRYSLIELKNHSEESEYYLLNSEPIGSGTFARIFKGVSVIKNGEVITIPEQEIVLKAMSKGKVSNAEVKREVEALHRFNPISHAVADSNNYYIVQPFIKGDDLMTAKKVSADPKSKEKLFLSGIIARLPLEKRLEVIEKMYENLEKLHSSSKNGIRLIHGDIKGQNIKLNYDEDQKEVEISIMDFGTTICVRDQDWDMPRTKDFVGTPLHLDPLNVDYLSIDFTSDVYALTGVTASILNATDPFSEKEKKLDMKQDSKKDDKEAEDEYQKKQAIRNNYSSKIKVAQSQEEKENLETARDNELTQLSKNTQFKNQMKAREQNKRLEEKRQRGENLKEFRLKKQLEVEATYSMDGLGDYLAMDAKDITLIKDFLEKTQRIYENKTDYQKRPSATQAKVFFAIMRNLYEEKMSHEQKNERRKIMKKIIDSPKLENNHYNALLNTVKNKNLSEEEKNLQLNSNFQQSLSFIIIKNLMGLLNPALKILGEESGRKTNKSKEALTHLINTIKADPKHYFQNPEDAADFNNLVTQWIDKLKVSKLGFFSPSADKRRKNIIENIRVFLTSITSKYSLTKDEAKASPKF
jgi:hypothetical protein